jgi:hypothetical protein
MNFITQLLETYKKGTMYDLVQKASKDLETINQSLENQNEEQHKEIVFLKTKIYNLDKEIEQSKIPALSPIDTYLKSQYKVIKNIAYENKRGYDVFLNQMITPNTFEVLKFRKSYTNDNNYEYIKKLGDKLAKLTTWVSEANLYDSGDWYLYPEETLTTYKTKCDCEDVSFTMCSMLPEYMGVCYGMFHKSNKEVFGHAYPILLYNDKLFIVETTGDLVEMTGFFDKRYETYFIITKDYTYRVKYGIEFGKLCNW